MSWEMEIKIAAARIEAELVQKYKDIATDLFQRICATTPVLKGRLRAGWAAGVGTPVTGKRGARHSGPNTVWNSVPQALATSEEFAGFKAALSQLRTLTGQPWEAYLSNGLKYVWIIEEEGYSHSKAPHGMASVSVKAVVDDWS
jgi:hypothetical protein